MSARSIQKDRGRKGYVDLLGIYASVSQKHVGNTSKESTALDKRLHSARKLYNTAARLADANVILQSCYKLLKQQEFNLFGKEAGCQPSSSATGAVH